MKRLLAAATLLIAVGSPTLALACSCMPPTQASVTANSDVVLAGRVVNVRRVGHSQFGRVFATIRVSRTYKGRLPQMIVVETRGNSAACGVDFKVGQSVRFGASRGERNYETGLCSQF